MSIRSRKNRFFYAFVSRLSNLLRYLCTQNLKRMFDKESLLKNLGIASLTPMQCQMDEQTRHKGGVVLLSPTGSGKTLAYLFPLVREMNTEITSLQAVVVVPTRELAQQSEEVLKRMKTGLRSISLHGGRSTMEEHRKIKEIKPQVVFATPGRLNDHLAKGNLDSLLTTTVVIDEFDKCLELGFQEEMNQLLLKFGSIERCWLTSATDAEEIPAFMSMLKIKFAKINFLEQETELKERITIKRALSPEKDKLPTLGRLLTLVGSKASIVFVSYRESVDRVWKYLVSEGFFAVAYHGGMEQEMRERALYKFRSGSANVLVSTDLAARGLDIPEVRVVVHYHMPLKAEEFTHRSGRTARWNSEGMIYLIQGPTEHLPEYLESEEITDEDLSQITCVKPASPKYVTIYIGRGKRDKLSKADVLGFFCKKGGLKATNIGRIDVGPHYAYAAIERGKVKDVLKRIANEKIKGMKTLIEVMRK